MTNRMDGWLRLRVFFMDYVQITGSETNVTIFNRDTNEVQRNCYNSVCDFPLIVISSSVKHRIDAIHARSRSHVVHFT